MCTGAVLFKQTVSRYTLKEASDFKKRTIPFTSLSLHLFFSSFLVFFSFINNNNNNKRLFMAPYLVRAQCAHSYKDKDALISSHAHTHRPRCTHTYTHTGHTPPCLSKSSFCYVLKISLAFIFFFSCYRCCYPHLLLTFDFFIYLFMYR